MNKEHGSPYDLGSADSYYCRPLDYSKFKGDDDKIREYMQGYFDQERTGDHKDYGDYD